MQYLKYYYKKQLPLIFHGHKKRNAINIPFKNCFISNFMSNNKSTPNADMNYKFVFSPIIPLVRTKIAKRNMPKLSVLLRFELVVAHLLRIMTLGFPSARKCQCAFNLLQCRLQFANKNNRFYRLFFQEKYREKPFLSGTTSTIYPCHMRIGRNKKLFG